MSIRSIDTDYGVRPLRRAIETFIEDPLAEELLKGEFAGQDVIKIKSATRSSSCSRRKAGRDGGTRAGRRGRCGRRR